MGLLLAVAGLVHFRIPLLPLPLFLSSPAHSGFALVEVGFDHFIDQVLCEAVDLFAEFVLLQQVPEGEKGCLIRDSIAIHVICCESAYRRHLD